MSGTNLADPAHCFDMAGGDWLLALWIAVEVRRLEDFRVAVAVALEDWQPPRSLESSLVE